jgi:hypothetical protein
MKEALRRLEQMVDFLRYHIVCDGFQMDEEAAERALQYFRRWAAEDQYEDLEEWEATIDFLADHGQSLDWVLFGDPAAMICKCAAWSKRAAVTAMSGH